RLIQSCGRVQGRAITSAMSAHILFPLIDTHPLLNFTLAAFARSDEGPRARFGSDFACPAQPVSPRRRAGNRGWRRDAGGTRPEPTNGSRGGRWRARAWGQGPDVTDLRGIGMPARVAI